MKNVIPSVYNSDTIYLYSFVLQLHSTHLVAGTRPKCEEAFHVQLSNLRNCVTSSSSVQYLLPDSLLEILLVHCIL